MRDVCGSRHWPCGCDQLPLFCVDRITSNCFLVLACDEPTETKQIADVKKSHLFVMLHGLHGAGSDLHYLRDQLTDAVKGGTQAISRSMTRSKSRLFVDLLRRARPDHGIERLRRL